MIGRLLTITQSFRRLLLFLYDVIYLRNSLVVNSIAFTFRPVENQGFLNFYVRRFAFFKIILQ